MCAQIDEVVEVGVRVGELLDELRFVWHLLQISYVTGMAQKSRYGRDTDLWA